MSPWDMLADILEYYTGVRPETGDTEEVWGAKIRPAWEQVQQEKRQITLRVESDWHPNNHSEFGKKLIARLKDVKSQYGEGTTD